jgi:hypothetical protein
MKHIKNVYSREELPDFLDFIREEYSQEEIIELILPHLDYKEDFTFELLLIQYCLNHMEDNDELKKVSKKLEKVYDKFYNEVK